MGWSSSSIDDTSDGTSSIVSSSPSSWGLDDFNTIFSQDSWCRSLSWDIVFQVDDFFLSDACNFIQSSQSVNQIFVGSLNKDLVGDPETLDVDGEESW
jgi:hypothetical protein